MHQLIKKYLACLHCGQAQRFPLCPACQRTLAKVSWPCPLCGQHQTTQQNICSDCQRSTPIHRLISPYYYQGLIRLMIHDLKYHHKLYWQHALTPMLVQALLQAPWPLPEALVPVPLHNSKFRSRGFNQAFILAKTLGQRLNIATIPLLKRIKATPALHTLTRLQRAHSLQDSFLCKPNTMHHLILVDDIYTTGATLRACSLAIKKVNPHCKISWITISQARLKPR